MFDVDNEQKNVELHEEEPKAGSENAKFMRRIIVLCVVVGVLVAGLGIAAVYLTFRGDGVAEVIDDGGITSSEEDDGGFLGLQNPGKLTDIDPTTPEDMQEEFNSRPETTPSDSANFERAISNYLTLGDFEGLGSYIREQMDTYGGPSEEYAQSEVDWSGKFPLLGNDVQTALYLIGKQVESPSAYFKNFSDPEILAATIAWAPMSSKLDAFLDYSALILPPPDKGDNIHLEEYDYGTRVNEVLAEISKNTGTQYLDVKSYNMEVCGHPIRVTVVMNSMGYYEPWSVQDCGGGLDPSVWNKRSIQATEARIYYRNDIDGVYFLSPPDELPSKEEHPDWFDEDGIYIGPVGGENAALEQSNAETPQTEAPAGEGGAENSAESETPAEVQESTATAPES